MFKIISIFNGKNYSFKFNIDNYEYVSEVNYTGNQCNIDLKQTQYFNNLKENPDS